ncbi:MAG: hypothetical protein JST28_10595 [Acidobacteria bacterium]|nr:hypothetical protein [Acidobacteriota bacterium]
MRKFIVVLLAGLLVACSMASGVAQNRSSRSGSGQIVIVFKDGHRQSFNMGEISRIEFPGGEPVADAGPTPLGAPPRGHFLGKWEVGDGNGRKFTITLNEDGSAWRSLHRIHGRWSYVNGEARVRWDDGAQDCIRRVDGQDKKAAYRAGKLFTDEPDNVTEARNTSRGPV